MRTPTKFTTVLNLGALVLLMAAVVALLLSPKAPPKAGRQLASEVAPDPVPAQPVMATEVR